MDIALPNTRFDSRIAEAKQARAKLAEAFACVPTMFADLDAEIAKLEAAAAGPSLDSLSQFETDHRFCLAVSTAIGDAHALLHRNDRVGDLEGEARSWHNQMMGVSMGLSALQQERQAQQRADVERRAQEAVQKKADEAEAARLRKLLGLEKVTA